MLHGSDSEETAKKELEFFFPMEQTVAVIKPDAVGTKGKKHDLDAYSCLQMVMWFSGAHNSSLKKFEISSFCYTFTGTEQHFQICRIYRNCMIISWVRLFFTFTLTFYRWDYWQNPWVWIQDCSTKRNEFNPRAGRRVLCWAQRKGILWWFSGTHD